MIRLNLLDLSISETVKSFRVNLHCVMFAMGMTLWDPLTKQGTINIKQDHVECYLKPTVKMSIYNIEDMRFQSIGMGVNVIF